MPEHHIKLDLSPTKNIRWRVGARDADGRVSQSFGVHPNQVALIADIQKKIADLDFEVLPTHRLLVGFNTNEGLRGWVDYSLEQLLSDHPAI